MLFSNKQIGGHASCPANTKFRGDPEDCEPYVNQSAVLLGNLKQRMQIEGVKVDKAYTRLKDNTVLTAISNNAGLAAIDSVEIDVTRSKKARGEKDRIVGFIAHVHPPAGGRDAATVGMAVPPEQGVPPPENWEDSDNYLSIGVYWNVLGYVHQIDKKKAVAGEIPDTWDGPELSRYNLEVKGGHNNTVNSFYYGSLAITQLDKYRFRPDMSAPTLSYPPMGDYSSPGYPELNSWSYSNTWLTSSVQSEGPGMLAPNVYNGGYYSIWPGWLPEDWKADPIKGTWGNSVYGGYACAVYGVADLADIPPLLMNITQTNFMAASEGGARANALSNSALLQAYYTDVCKYVSVDKKDEFWAAPVASTRNTFCHIALVGKPEYKNKEIICSPVKGNSFIAVLPGDTDYTFVDKQEWIVGVNFDTTYDAGNVECGPPPTSAYNREVRDIPYKEMKSSWFPYCVATGNMFNTNVYEGKEIQGLVAHDGHWAAPVGDFFRHKAASRKLDFHDFTVTGKVKRGQYAVRAHGDLDLILICEKGVHVKKYRSGGDGSIYADTSFKIDVGREFDSVDEVIKKRASGQT